MPKPYTFPILLDEVKTISIKSLKGWNYLQSFKQNGGVITWSINGVKTSSVRIRVEMRGDYGTLFLSYSIQQESIYYSVKLEAVPSNLGKGVIWFFRCPHTQKCCRKLYFLGKYFSHREADPNAMYSSQTYSKYSRAQIAPLKAIFKYDQFIQEGTQLREFYNGKPTKRFQKIQTLRREVSRLT